MKTIILFFSMFLIFYSCCSPKGNESLPLLTWNFRAYVGSAPEYFLLNCFYENQILCEKFGNFDSIVVEKNSVTISDGAKISLVSQGINTMDADFYARVPYGEGIRFYFRAAGKDFEKSSKLIFEYTTKGSKLYENTNLIVNVDSIKLNNEKQSRVFIQNEGEIVHVIVGIDTVFQGRTKIPLSEYIYVEPINSKVIIDDVYFYDLIPQKFSY